jgi:hypothetical protein
MASTIRIALAVLAAAILWAPISASAAASVVVDVGFSGYTYCEHLGWPWGDQFTNYRNADAQWGSSHPLLTEKRGFMSFNTQDIIQGNFTVRKVELYYAHHISYSSGPGVPVSWGTRLYIGRFLYGWLGADDWNAGTYTARHDWYGGPHNEWIDLGPAAVTWFQQYGTDGWTDIKLSDISMSYPGDWTAIPQSYLEAGKLVPNICKLKITYDPYPGPVVDTAAKGAATRSTWGSIKAAYR